MNQRLRHSQTTLAQLIRQINYQNGLHAVEREPFPQLNLEQCSQLMRMAEEFFLGRRIHVNALTLLILINTATSIQIICVARGFWPYYSGTSNHLYCKPTPCFTQRPCKLFVAVSGTCPKADSRVALKHKAS